MTVEYDWTAATGDCVLLTIFDTDERFAIPFDQVDDVAEAMVRLAHEETGMPLPLHNVMAEEAEASVALDEDPQGAHTGQGPR